jgi:ParB/RepB/Spo0J family partition protein
MPESKNIPLAQLIPPPDAQRSQMDEEKMHELVSSIRMMGILNPLIVIPVTESRPLPVEGTGTGAANPSTGTMPRYQIRAGHRRFIAAGLAGLTEVPCRVYDDPNFNAVAATIHENAAREQVNPVEEGWYYLEIASRENITEEELKTICGQRLEYIYQRIELVKGDEEIVMAVLRGDLTMAAAKELNKCTDEAHRRYLLMLALEQGATSRVILSWVIQWKQSVAVSQPAQPGVQPSPEVAQIAAVLPRCVLCEQDEQQFNLVNVYICRAELNTIKAMLNQQTER